MEPQLGSLQLGSSSWPRTSLAGRKHRIAATAVTASLNRRNTTAGFGLGSIATGWIRRSIATDLHPDSTESG